MEELIRLINATVTDTALANSLINTLKQKELVVRTKDEETTFKTNFLNQEKENLLKEEKKTIFRRIEDDIKEQTGLTQNPSEPYHEFLKRGISSIKTQLTKVTEEKTALEQASANGSVWETKYKTLEQQSKDAIAAKEKELSEIKKVTDRTVKLTKIQEHLAPLEAKFVKDLPSYFKAYKDSVINEMLASTAEIDGKLVLVDENGNPRKDANLNNIEVDKVLTEKFKDVIQVDKTQGGAGTNQKVTTPSGSPIVVPDDIKTQADVTAHLAKSGLLQGTKEFDEAFASVVKEKNIEKVF